MEERLQKYMARCGVDSRRKCEELIARGLVDVNGETVREPGVKINPSRDRVRVEGKPLRLEKPAHYLHYKIRGVTTTVSDDLGRKTVMDCLPDIPERVYPVGRLDKDSEGLLVLTNDGALANYLTHPAHGVGKTYRVVAEGRVPEETLAALGEKGIRLGPVLVKPSRVELVRYDNDNTVVLISVSEGINREVRRIFAALGHEVKKLLRTQIGPLSLAGMKRAATRPLTPRELSLLAKGMAGIEVEAGTERFPPGSAAGRKPSGPRGRPKRGKAPRRGKPDPAAARPAGSVKVVEDDWQKRKGGKANRRSGRKAEAAAKPTVTVRAGKALRPIAPKPGRAASATAKTPSAPAARPAGKPPAPGSAPRPRKKAGPGSAFAHPLAASPAKPARPAAPARAWRRRHG